MTFPIHLHHWLKEADENKTKKKVKRMQESAETLYIFFPPNKLDYVFIYCMCVCKDSMDNGVEGGAGQISVIAPKKSK